MSTASNTDPMSTNLASRFKYRGQDGPAEGPLPRLRLTEGLFEIGGKLQKEAVAHSCGGVFPGTLGRGPGPSESRKPAGTGLKQRKPAVDQVERRE
jgi:hypothetical protein